MDLISIFTVALPQSSGQSVWILPEALAELASDGDFTLVEELIDVFVADIEQRICLLEQSEAADIAGAGTLSHCIKGSARQMNLMAFADIAAKLEKAASGPQEPVSHLANELIAAWPTARSIMVAVKRAIELR